MFNKCSQVLTYECVGNMIWNEVGGNATDLPPTEKYSVKTAKESKNETRKKPLNKGAVYIAEECIFYVFKYRACGDGMFAVKER